MTALLFDMYGVLMRNPGPRGFANLQEILGADESVWQHYRALREEYDAARLSDAAFWATIRERAGLGDFDVEAATAADCAMALERDPEMVSLVTALARSGQTVGVLSNIPARLSRIVREQNPWLGELTAVTFSCDIHRAKPEPEAFNAAVAAFGDGVPAADVVFFDDRADYCAAARAAGLQAVQFTGIQTLLAEFDRRNIPTPHSWSNHA